MLGAALSIGVLLALLGSGAAGRALQGCAIPPQELTRMLQILERSVAESEMPNPSVLLAFNLAGATGSNARQQLLKQIEEEAVKRAQKDMSSGQVALCTLALLSSCRDPQHVESQGLSVNLPQVLQQKTRKEMARLEEYGVPLTTLYSVGLDVLALCLTRTGDYEQDAVILAKQLLNPESQIDVDTQAVVALALECVYDQTKLDGTRDLLHDALKEVANSFLDKQAKGNGVIGNIYSTSLAMQVLETASKFYAPREWDCAQAFSAVYSHQLQQPMAVAQALPALVHRPYLDVASLDCSVVAVTIPQLSPTPSQATTAPEGPPIKVYYSVTNNLKGKPFDISITVHVPAGSTLLAVLQAAEKENPKEFSFKTKPTSWGPMVVSIHGLAGSDTDRTFWEFFSGADSLQEGVSVYKPRDGEHIRAVFSTY
ncbi:cobalamin binding intrinsic factor [Oxyura jamaicensis]|uniref:cobalamin binding intrinsic factor n=1 Tax=Oxyura jamaicensis TaxID=8884 RepID=UPI0015A57DD1|nr:cobalamin binding intrinsic factor [Oxyura jamaicensis]